MKLSEKKYSCAIVDNDPISIEILSDYIAMIPKLKLTESYLNPLVAVNEIKKQEKIDFLFLDIKMEISGLDVAVILREYVNFIFFVTGYSEHALAAFSVEGDSFLLKPLDFSKFLFTVNRAIGSPLNSEN